MRIGIIGLGNISKFMVETIKRMDPSMLYAVGSRNLEKAQNYAKTHGFKKAYGSYEDLVKDENVELVYIATPHSIHYETSMLALKHNKPVLCEKSFMGNARQAKEVLDFAKRQNVFIAEAIWTRYMPSCAKLKQLIKSGVIGKITSFSANLGYNIHNIERIAHPELGGGALLDVGVYPVQFANAYFGSDIKSITSTCTKNEFGVDIQGNIIIKYNNGITGILHYSALAVTDQIGAIHGENGFIVVENINNIKQIQVYKRINNVVTLHETYTAPKQITGFEYQVNACIEAIKAGKLECEEIPHSDTLQVMELMDSLRKEWGVVFPFD